VSDTRRLIEVAFPWSRPPSTPCTRRTCGTATFRRCTSGRPAAPSPPRARRSSRRWEFVPFQLPYEYPRGDGGGFPDEDRFLPPERRQDLG
jgi:hypothetical protein